MRRVVRGVQQARDARYSLLRGYFHGRDDEEDMLERDSVRLRSISLGAQASSVGRRLGALGLAQMGVEVTAVRRRGIRAFDPQDDTVLEPGDIACRGAGHRRTEAAGRLGRSGALDPLDPLGRQLPGARATGTRRADRPVAAAACRGEGGVSTQPGGRSRSTAAASSERIGTRGSAGMRPSPCSIRYRRQHTRRKDEKFATSPRWAASSSYSRAISWLTLMPSRCASSASTSQNSFPAGCWWPRHAGAASATGIRRTPGWPG